ncbi:hypothetical protein BDZ91DRAFT_733534 [Kalaharituber pfeilii]|nr:hypothetical protein BDZ91DRAFT_733534 [Kalaharituber pfeilii]
MKIPKSRISGTQTPPQRDPDLVDADVFLPTAVLDELWDWFCTAIRKNGDPELVFVKLINSARNPYREVISSGMKNGVWNYKSAPDLISMEEGGTIIDPVKELQEKVASLQTELAAKEQLVAALEARDERWVRELVEKDRLLEEKNTKIEKLQQDLIEQEREMGVALVEKEKLLTEKEREVLLLREEYQGAVTQLQNSRNALVHKTTEMEVDWCNDGNNRGRSQEEVQGLDEKVKKLEEELAARERELQEMGNEFGGKIARKDEEIAERDKRIEEQIQLGELRQRELKSKMEDMEKAHNEGRSKLIQTVCTNLGKHHLTPSAIGLQGDEWPRGSSPLQVPPQCKQQ